MYYLYILHSASSDKFYVGQTNDIQRRLDEHNHQQKNSYTAKYRPWRLVKLFEVGESLGQARKIENHVKSMKSRKYIERLIDREDIDDSISRYDESA